jgi:hypothetical protein
MNFTEENTMTNPALAKADKWLRSPRYAGTAEPTILALKAALQEALGVEPEKPKRPKLKVVTP